MFHCIVNCIVFIYIFCVLFVPGFQHTICVKKTNITRELCKSLTRNKCVYIPDSINCILKLQENEANFASFNSEQLYLLAHLLNESTPLVVIEEIRNLHRLNDDYEFKTVVLMRRNISDQLNGSKYCHPGFYDSLNWSRRVLKKFEQSILKDVQIESSNEKFIGRTFENEIFKLAQFFGPSCRPGNWVDDDTLNDELHEKYKSLNALCQSKDNNYHFRALDCLTIFGGDIAYVDYNQMQNYFKTRHHINKKDFIFYCEDGGRVPIDDSNPCTWVKQPLPAIVAIKKYSSIIKNHLIREDDNKSRLNNTILRIMGVQDNEQMYPTDVQKLVSEYVFSGREPAELNPFDKTTDIVKFCTTSTVELEKCEIFRTAALVLGIIPEIECVQPSTKSLLKCFEKIKEGSADIVVSDTNYGFIARKYYALSEIGFEKPPIRSYIVAVIKESNTTGIKNFNHLKGKNACFSLFQGIDWQAAETTIKQYESLTDDSLLFYFNKTYFVNEEHFDFITNNSQMNILQLYSQTDNFEFTNYQIQSHDDNLKLVLDCLDNSGDIAFVSLKNLNELDDKYHVICRNNTVVNASEVDQACVIRTIITREILSRNNETNNIDYQLLLNQIEKYFNGRSPFQTMNVFSKFKHKNDILFSNDANGFYPVNFTNDFIREYKKLIYDNFETERNGELSMGYYVLIFGSVIIILMMMAFVIYNVVMKSEYHRANRVEF